jgi:hypothetical protein
VCVETPMRSNHAKCAPACLLPPASSTP